MQIKKLTALITLAGIAGAAHATDGYFSDGYGMKAKGMGGAATAMADDAFGGANNPASMAFVGNRLDLGIDVFSPRRSATRTGLGPLDMSVTSDSNYFPIPEFGYNRMLNPNLALGVSVYGNGGMNTDYPGGQINCGGGPANMLCGSGKLGVDLMQLIIAPTAAYKIAPDHSIGISPLIGYQRFKAEGLQAFANTPGVSSNPANVTNRGYDDIFGYGVRIGYMGKIAPNFTIGAAYASKMSFDKFGKYAGLFAEQGHFDIPENYNLGVAWQAIPQVKLALDYQRINYSGVNSIGNPSTNAAQLGADNGPGFGWSDINVWKLGVEYQYNTQWTLRAGYNHADNPIQARDVTFNILAPGVVKDHATLGFTYTLASGNELTMSYMHAFKNDVSGASILPVFGGGSPAGTEKIDMYQDSLGIAYSWKM
ncbi:MAG: outer membrane protein transport protein [Thiobacillaceae bacterium]